MEKRSDCAASGHAATVSHDADYQLFARAIDGYYVHRGQIL